MPTQRIQFDLIRSVLACTGLTVLFLCNGCDEAEPQRASPLLRAGSANTGAGNSQPNIILINLDDADCATVEYDFRNPGGEERFPNMNRLANEGVRFSNCHIAVPICGPSRACLMTGQYAYKTGIRCNSPSNPQSRGVGGGYGPYRDGGPFGTSSGPPYRDNDIGTWMQDAGYRTMFVGKYLHDDFQAQPGENFLAVCPSGWDDFYPSMGGRYFRTYMLKKGKFGFLPDLDPETYPVKYRTAVESVDAQNLIRDHVSVDRRPFFLYVAPFAPHSEDVDERSFDESEPAMGMVEPQYKNSWPDLKAPPSAAYDEADVSDKPEAIRNLPRLTESGTDPMKNDRLNVDTSFRRRMLALRSVDDMIGKLLKLLDETGQLEHTVVILTSDHGYQLGQQRHIGKATPYDRVTRVPLYVWAPGRMAHKAENPRHLLSQIDLAPTILEIAGAKIPEDVQGKSFLPLLDSSFDGQANEWRPEGILIENWESISDRRTAMNTSFQSVRMFNSVYTEWANGDREYYDLATDPDQMENGYAKLDEEKQNRLGAMLRRLKLEMPQPVCFMESPFTGSDVHFQQIRMGGLAEFKEGIEEVRLIVSDITDSENVTYWTGTEWSETRRVNSATLASPGSILTEWSYDFAPQLAEGRLIRVAARAIGKGGVASNSPVIRDFAIDSDYPVTRFLEPPYGRPIRLGKGIVIKGESEDEKGILAVRMVIFDPEKKLYWNDQQWQTEELMLRTKIDFWFANRALWSYTFLPPEPKGSVRVLVRTESKDGRADKRMRSLKIDWDK